LVEDEDLIAMEVSDRLRTMGYEVCGHAARGESALKEIPGAEPDVILMDINLGHGLSGIDVARALRGRVDAPVIFLTAYSDAELVEQAAGTYSFAFVLKPLRAAGLRATIEMTLARYRAERALVDANERLAAAEEKSRRNAARFADLFEFAPDAMLLVEESGRIAMANRQAEVLLGYQSEEICGESVEMLIPEPLRAAHSKHRARFLSEGSPRRMGVLSSNLRAVRKNGTTVPVDICLSPMTLDEGPHVAVAIRDLTEQVLAREERQALEARLRHAQKMEAVGALAGGIAHDFNNLLFTIVANLAIARLEPLSEVLEESLGQMAGATDRAGSLVRRMLSFSRRDPPARRRVSLADVVYEALDLLRSSIPNGVALSIEVEADLEPALADPLQIHQVVTNLVSNSLFAVGDSGRISVTLQTRAVGPEHRVSVSSGAYVCLTVADDGVGMDGATKERVFEPFFTSKEVGQGSGLGMSVVHGIVEEHGGAIDVQSSPGEGTSITVYLPAIGHAGQPAGRGEVGSTTAPRQPVRATGELVRVLFIDDEPSVVDAAKRFLQRLGYAVRGFIDPAVALEVLGDDPSEFDIVLTDYKMPEIDGIEVARRVGLLREDLPVILVSGYAERGQERLTRSGIRRLDKPFGLTQLSQALRDALGKG
jgi:PAS domain S-box-containing protein